MYKILKSWLTPLVISGLLFGLVRPTFAQVIEEQANLAQYLIANDVEVESDVIDGFHQVYYIFNGNKTYITEGSLNATTPMSVGEYIVYRRNTGYGTDNIFLYHITTDITVQLNNVGHSRNPTVDRAGRVVWEELVDGTWQIFFFDGKSVKQLTAGDLSLNSSIEGDYIVYGRKDVSDTWRSVVYSISRKEERDIATGISSKKPKVREGKIVLAGTGVEEMFPLTVDDLFLLNLSPLSSTPSPSPEPEAPETVTEEDIIEELSATPSAELDSTQTPESSSSGQSEATPTPAP